MNWINTIDRLPAATKDNDSVNVLARTEEDEYTIAFYDYDVVAWFYAHSTKLEQIHGVTHWMYIPLVYVQQIDMSVPVGYLNK